MGNIQGQNPTFESRSEQRIGKDIAHIFRWKPEPVRFLSRSHRRLLIRWSQVRIPHDLPRIKQKAHEFAFAGFLLSKTFCVLRHRPSVLAFRLFP